MRTTSFSSVSYRFLAALAVIAMVLAALPVTPAYAASIVVETTADDLTADGNCSLREAIINATNNGSPHPDCAAGSGLVVDVITLTGGQEYILTIPNVISTPQTGDLDVSDPAGLTIQSNNTTRAIINANGIDRVLDVAVNGGNVTLNYITITGGAPASGLTGGGINFGSAGTLNITNSVISNNTATSATSCGAGLFNNTAATVNITNSTFENNDCTVAGADGGGIFKGNSGTLNISNSTFVDNDAAENGGAAHFSPSTVNITNSTFFHNTADKGGAIQTGGATVTVEFSTFSGNEADSVGVNKGGAIQVSSGAVAINRSILANSVGNDCDQTTGFGVATITNSLVEADFDCDGTATTSADPGLGALADNGGGTFTMAINASSPAYNAAASCNSITTDQRGISRPQANSCDLGAFEVAADPLVLSVVAANPINTSAATVQYTVTFSEPVTGVGASDFSLTQSGVVGATVIDVTPASGFASVFTVTVNTGNGSGTLQLRVPSSASIVDDENNGIANLPFNTGDTYNVTKAPTVPGAATLNSPSGTINTTKPTYSWNAVFGASHYLLWVNAPSGNGFIQQWFTAAAAGCPNGTGTCSATPATTLAAGNHTWWIRTWNNLGYGPWSAGMAFNVVLPPPPGAANLVSPNGNTTDTLPTYTWNAVSGATHYYLWVNGPSGNVIKLWYLASNVCSGGTCSVEHPTALKAGAHNWWIRTWNAGGYGPWSTAMSFTVNTPGAATLVSPNGNTNVTTPTYTWNEVPGATHYYLWVNAPSGNGFIKQWFKVSDGICTGGTCSATPTQALSLGAHTWYIRTWSSAGYGLWSSGQAFTVTP